MRARLNDALERALEKEQEASEARLRGLEEKEKELLETAEAEVLSKQHWRRGLEAKGKSTGPRRMEEEEADGDKGTRSPLRAGAGAAREEHSPDREGERGGDAAEEEEEEWGKGEAATETGTGEAEGGKSSESGEEAAAGKERGGAGAEDGEEEGETPRGGVEEEEEEAGAKSE